MSNRTRYAPPTIAAGLTALNLFGLDGLGDRARRAEWDASQAYVEQLASACAEKRVTEMAGGAL